VPDPEQVAAFRLKMITPLLGEEMTKAMRRKAMRKLSRRVVRWPEGQEKAVSRSGLYRWWKAYQGGGLEALKPALRKDCGTSRADRSSWIDKAIHLLLVEPARSLNFLLVLLATYFPSLSLSRSTLDRDLKRHPAFPGIRRLREGTRRLRRRFQAAAPHQVWQLDGKGSFRVRFGDGQVRRVTVLSILDDHSRAVLAAVVAPTESLGAAVRVFREAAARWGLPRKMYCDRHSVYDSDVFRTGLALLGAYRIEARPKNAPARGKIEAYHRFLNAWFVRELKHQVVVDEVHLDQLLQGAITVLYQRHRHRGLRASPEATLAGRVSPRRVTIEDLRRAFRETRKLKAHPKTGELDLPGGLFLVPRPYAGQKVTVKLDPADPAHPVLVTRQGIELPLIPAFEPEPAPAEPLLRQGPGALQRVLDVHRGRHLPQADPGFGLPEVFDALARRLGRRVPLTADEGLDVQAFCEAHGPFAQEAFSRALERTGKDLGPGRPLRTILRHLARLIPHTTNAKETP
jgi:transposase InsO family protein